MVYKELFFDFIDRTTKIIGQYDQYVTVDEKDKFEVTLFINCLVGLLMFPRGKEEIFDLLPDTSIDKLPENWGINNCQWLDENKKIVTLKYLVRRLRNSIAHARFESNSRGVLDKLIFMDAPNKKSIDFIIEISIDDLRIFASKLADFAMKNYKLLEI